MWFLRRLLGRDSTTARGAWYDAPARGDLEVYGTQHHHAAFSSLLAPGPHAKTREIKVELVREPANPHDSNAVAVLATGSLLGYIPRECAPAWSSFIESHLSESRRVRATARVWGVLNPGHTEPIFRLYLGIPEDPAEYAAAERRSAERQARHQQKLAQVVEYHPNAPDRPAAQRAREQQARQAEEWRQAGRCIDCGATLVRVAGARGRPPVRCPAHAAEHRRPSQGRTPDQ